MTWTAAACCRFPVGSLLPVNVSTAGTLYRCRVGGR